MSEPGSKWHKCSSPRCDCPIHARRMYYHISGNAHACQNPECEYASGYEEALVARGVLRERESSRLDQAKRWERIR